MVISKTTTVVQPRSCIKEPISAGHSIMLTSNSSATLPRVRTVTRRVAELPSLRYGSIGAGSSVSGPLRVREASVYRQPATISSSTGRKYARSFTAAVIGDNERAIRSMQPRRVRFDLPPTDGSDDSDQSPSVLVRYLATSGSTDNLNSMEHSNVNTRSSFKQSSDRFASNPSLNSQPSERIYPIESTIIFNENNYTDHRHQQYYANKLPFEKYSVVSDCRFSESNNNNRQNFDRNYYLNQLNANRNCFVDDNFDSVLSEKDLYSGVCKDSRANNFSNKFVTKENSKLIRKEDLYRIEDQQINQNRYQRGLQSGRQQPPVQSVRVTTGTLPARQRAHAHPVGAYVRGTLSPTASTCAPAPRASTALLRAARDGDDTLARDALRRMTLLGSESDAEVNAVDCSGRTALSYIASNGPVDILESVLQLPGLDPNIPDNEGNTPLHFAAQAGQVECLNFLLSRCQGLEIDARNHLGFTPLMKAALQGRNKCAKLLLFAGANPTLRDTGRGLRAEQWARYCGRYVCADVIEKFARHRLLERSTSCGRWGSESDIGGTRLLLGKVVTVAPQPVGPQSGQNQGIKSKLRKVFRTSSGPSQTAADLTSSSARLVTQLTSAALCASSPILPTAPTVPPVVKSLIRPLTVPRLQITLANGAATLTGDVSSLSTLIESDRHGSKPANNVIEKPPRIKKKMK